MELRREISRNQKKTTASLTQPDLFHPLLVGPKGDPLASTRGVIQMARKQGSIYKH